MQNFYSSVSEIQLQEYAEKAGLGGDNPMDLQQFMRLLKVGSRVLEVGCGIGRLGKHLIKYFSYVGIDNHIPYLERFKEFLQKKGYKEVDCFLHYCSFQDFNGKSFDAILFPWTVIGDFKEGEQVQVIKKARDMLNNGGLILLDNPAKETIYNTSPGYKPNKFYFDEWKDRLVKLGFKEVRCINYETSTGRIREITILKK